LDRSMLLIFPSFSDLMFLDLVLNQVSLELMLLVCFQGFLCVAGLTKVVRYSFSQFCQYRKSH
jgi:hypothetical protein